MRSKRIPLILFTLVFGLSLTHIAGQAGITTPKELFGFTIGDDYYLANYTQLVSYWEKLAGESERISLVTIGKTAEDRPIVMAIITSPENQRKLDRFREISRRLALAEGLTDDKARELAAEGRAVVWIDGGLHGTEVLGAQQLIELAYQMVSGSDAETLRILDDVILLVVCPNPDGMELVSNWYMRDAEPTKRSTRNLPRLYQKYIGHDNNRDFYMSTQPETKAVNQVFYHEWFPQIVYNHHQSGPAGTVLFAPPFRDPFNYLYDSLIPVGIELVGAAMHNRFVAEDKPGATMRLGAGYSIWWNGGLRTTVYYHNMIGILTETIGNPTPMEIPFLPERQLPSNDYPYPIAPQKWHFRQSVEYAITADKAILDVASKHREDFLYNIYQMGRNSIQRGSRDHWTITPNRVTRVEEAIKKEMSGQTGAARFRGYPVKYYEMLRDPSLRDPRGYIIPSDQPDFLTAIKFVNALIRTGITVHRASGAFEVAGKTYPGGSFVIQAAQAFRPHLLSLFEPQNHPDDLLYPGGPPRPTYDMAGWTLAFQMGVQFDRILDGFEGPSTKVEGLVQPPPGKVTQAGNAAGFLLSHQVNDAFIAVNRLLGSNEEVYWLKQPFRTNGKTYPAGVVYIPRKSTTAAKLEKLSRELGLNFEGTRQKPAGKAFRLRPPRIGLWDRYGGSMSSGWIRWLLEQFEFPFEVVYPPALDAGNLERSFDVLIFPGGAIPSDTREEGEYSFEPPPPASETIPTEYHNQLGTITPKKTIPQLLQFLKNGGSILTIGSSTNLGFHAGLPIKNALMEKLQDGTEKPLPREKYFIPGSILQVRVDNSNPIAWGMLDNVDVTFSFSPVFQLLPEASLTGIKPVVWFDSATPLRSGWAWGQHYLEKGVVAIEAEYGKGKLFLFGPEITFRGQPHGTFKFLFNGLYYGTSPTVDLR